MLRALTGAALGAVRGYLEPWLDAATLDDPDAVEWHPLSGELVLNRVVRGGRPRVVVECPRRPYSRRRRAARTARRARNHDTAPSVNDHTL